MSFTRQAYGELFNSASSTTVAASSFASVAGRPIAGFVGWEGGNTTVSVADTAGNDYEVGTPSVHSNSDQVVCGFYCLTSLGNASNVVTVTFGAARTFRTIQVEEYSAGAPVSYDGTNTGHATGTNTVTTGGITTTASIGLLFAGVKVYNTIPTITATAPLTQIAQLSTYGATGDRQLSAAGTYTASFGTSAGTDLSAVAMAFKEAPSETVSTVTGSTVTEGGNIVYTVTLSGATAWDTAFTYSWGGTATSADYTSTLTTAMCNNSVTVSGATGSGGTFTVPSGVSSFTVTVPTTPDTIDEADETVILNLPGSVSGTGTITDDDAPPTVSISDATESFGTVTHTLTLSQASGKTITVQVDSANGSKTAGTHYTAITAQTVTFLPGETEQTVPVTVL